MNQRVVRVEFTAEERLHTALTSTLRANGASPEAAIALLGKVAREATWKHLPRHIKGEQDGAFWSFTDYVRSPTAEGGLGLNEEDVKALVHIRTEVERRAVGSDRAKELEEYRYEVLTAMAVEIPVKPKNGEIGRGRERNSGTVPNPKRDSASDVISRLKRDDPELAESVVRGEITANAAARVKGWRYPRVELRNPITVAARIKTTFTPEQIAQLVTELTHTKEV
jgi:hypothetical protein